MLALVSSRSAREIGCWVFEKNVSFCLAPSSKTSNSSSFRSVVYFPWPSVAVTLSETSSTPLRIRCPWAAVSAVAPAGGETDGDPAERA